LYFTDWGATPSINAVALNSTSAVRSFVVMGDIIWPNGLSLDPQGKTLREQQTLVGQCFLNALGFLNEICRKENYY